MKALNDRLGETYHYNQVTRFLKTRGLQAKYDRVPLPDRKTTRSPVLREKVRWGYVIVRLERHKWRGKHLLIWEEANGSIPEGHRIVFIDGNKLNYDINNLEIVTGSEYVFLNVHLKWNNVESLEVRKSLITLAKLHAKRSELESKTNPQRRRYDRKEK